ncbi:MAG: dockerin type I domain-containing protein [Bacteriovoracia bacterium]
MYSTASHDGVQGDFVVGADRELIESRTWTYGLFRIGNLRDGDRRLQVDVRISGVGSESGDAFYVIEPFRSSHRLDGSDWGFVALPSLPGRYCLRFEVKDELGAIETVLYRRFARLPGDINGDGKVESRDLNSVQAYFRVDGAPSDFSFRSDVDVNGMVDPDDTSVIRQGVTRNLNLGRISPPDCGGSGEPR